MDSQSIYSDPEKLFAALTQGNPNIPKPTFPSLSGVQQQAKVLSHQIFADWDLLSAILDRHEATLRKRWIKKTADQRRKVLLLAFPTMPATHRPDFEALRREKEEQRRAGTHFHDSFILPSVNLEDLMKPKHLLLFINSRGRNPPSMFVNSDMNSVHLGSVTGAVTPSYLSGYTMLLAGQDSADTYGRLVSWDEDEDAFDMMSKGTGIQPGEGLLVLEIQQRKMHFLLRCTEIILQDLPLQDLKVPKQPVPAEIVMRDEVSEWPSLSKEILEAPYRVPDRVNVGRLQSFVSAKRDEAEDHIWLLREDPSYFKDTVLSWSEHRQERILTTSGASHPILRRDEFWERVLGNVIVEAYGAFLIWDLLAKDVESIKKLGTKYGDHISLLTDLPEDYEQALCHFSHFLEQATKGPMGLWKVGVAASPPLRMHFVREPQDPNTTKIQVHSKSNTYNERDHFLWLLERLTMDDQVFLCGLDNLCDEIERRLRSDPKSRERISSWIANVLSDLSLLGELQRQINLLTPGPPITEALDLEEKQAHYSEKTKLLSKVFGILTNGMKLAAGATPLSKFTYPYHKRRNAQTTKEMQQAEKELDLFWQQVDDHCVRSSGQNLHELLSDVLETRATRRTSDWNDTDRAPRKEADHSLQPITNQFAALELERRTEQTISPGVHAALRQKEKTRGPLSEQASEAIEYPRELPTCNNQPPTFTVSKRGFKVFSSLFYTPIDDEPPGETPWSEFLSAMASVGFSIKSLDGSAWVFTPGPSDLFRRSIIFHEPHPSNKIPFRTIRRYWRRLERVYGWKGGMFVRE